MELSYYVNGFEAGRCGLNVVVDGVPMQEDNFGVVHVPFTAEDVRNGKQFGVNLSNFGFNRNGFIYHPWRRSYVDVTVHGVLQGTWILPANRKNAFLNRSLNDDGIWTLYPSTSAQGVQLAQQNNTSRNELGLIVVTFRPEYIDPTAQRGPGHLSFPNHPIPRVLGERGMFGPTPKVESSRSSVSGQVGLTGNSDVQFGQSAAFPTDNNLTVTLYIRLVCDLSPTTPRPIGGVRNGGGSSNVPPTPYL